ncbi:MAG: DNA primase, partial [Candidatus Omnitrophica bacterium]|nr:DNA primase [Candidatus Omnitrophota bacterium]
MAGIPDNVIDQIQDRIDIVEVIGSYLPLKKAGRNYRGLCPFHHEKTPSFMVSQDKQIFHCFGCGEGGNVFNFLMKYERLEFPEAVRMLAQKAGVVIPERLSAESKAQSSLSSKLYAANEMASAYFQNVLRQDSLGKKAYAYLLGRGLNDETIKMFRLGFASSSWDDLINYAKQKGTSADILEKSGLAIAKENGGYYDRFKERIMFTIFDPKSRILGFGGRVFLPPEADQPSADKANNSPKYMNSPETSIYNKGRNLYGLNFTWKFIRDEDEAVIVEGYLDLIVPFQHGIKNMVSSLGTSLTEDQIRLIGRYTKNTVIIFDPDKAGELATLRSLDLLLQEDLSVKVVRLPEGFDPDSFISRYGAQEFKNRIKTGQSLFDYKMSVLLSKYDKSRLEDKAKITGEMLPTIARVQNAVLQSGYIKM